MTLTRRSFIGTAAAGGLVSLAPGLRVALADTPSPDSNILVFLFLRFGMDGLSLVSPSDDGNYRDKRPTIAIPSSGPGAGIYLGQQEGTSFFMHPLARQLHQMFVDKKLAIVQAAGVPTENRSHFETQEMVTHGLADNEGPARSGWLTRHLTARAAPLGDFDAVSDGQGVTTSLDGLGGSLSFSNLSRRGFQIYGAYADALAAMHKGDGELQLAAQKTLRAAAAVREKALSLPFTQPNPNYTYGPLSNVLRPLAEVLKMDIGVQTATADFIGWDHHEYLSNNFSRQAQELSDALFAFTDDLGAIAKRVTIVAMTEFGRRVRENTNNGTDHGAGAPMLVMGAGVNGGKFYGHWPGLSDSVLDQGDLPVVTDYRQVLSEVLVKRASQSAIEQVFPTLSYKPLGIIT